MNWEDVRSDMVNSHRPSVGGQRNVPLAQSAREVLMSSVFTDMPGVASEELAGCSLCSCLYNHK